MSKLGFVIFPASSSTFTSHPQASSSVSWKGWGWAHASSKAHESWLYLLGGWICFEEIYNYPFSSHEVTHAEAIVALIRCHPYDQMVAEAAAASGFETLDSQSSRLCPTFEFKKKKLSGPGAGSGTDCSTPGVNNHLDIKYLIGCVVMLFVTVFYCWDAGSRFRFIPPPTVQM